MAAGERVAVGIEQKRFRNKFNIVPVQPVYATATDCWCFFFVSEVSGIARCCTPSVFGRGCSFKRAVLERFEQIPLYTCIHDESGRGW